MPRKIKVVDIQAVEEPVFETAQEEDVKDDCRCSCTSSGSRKRG